MIDLINTKNNPDEDKNNQNKNKIDESSNTHVNQNSSNNISNKIPIDVTRYKDISESVPERRIHTDISEIIKYIKKKYKKTRRLDL